MTDYSLRGPCIHGEEDATLCVRCEVDTQMHFAAELEAENKRLQGAVDTALVRLRWLTDHLRDNGQHDTADLTAEAYRHIRRQLENGKPA